MILLRLLSLLLACLLLMGCQNKDPLAYLPAASAGYIAVNLRMVEESEALMRLDKALVSDPGSPGFMIGEKANTAYIALSGIGGKIGGEAFGVAIGPSDMTDYMGRVFKDSGVTAYKTSGYDVYTTDSTSYALVGDSGVLFFQDQSVLRQMIAVSKGKEASARGTPEFTFVNSNVSGNFVSAAIKASDIWANIAPSTVQQLEMRSKPGADALREMTMISGLFNWKEHPVLEINLHVEDDATAAAAAALVNQVLAGLRTAPPNEVGPVLGQLVPSMTVSTNTHGVGISVRVPEALVESFFLKMRG
jgi:hypothetical protein